MVWGIRGQPRVSFPRPRADSVLELGDGQSPALSSVPESTLASNITINDGLDPLLELESIFVESYSPNFTFATTTLSRRFKVLNIEGDLIFWAGENTDCGSRCWRGMQRRYTYFLFSPAGQPLLKFDRQRIMTCHPCKCCCAFPSGSEAPLDAYASNAELMTILDTHIYHAMGLLYGTMKNCSSACVPQYEIEDASGQNLINIRSNCCGSVCPFFNCRNAYFHLYDNHRQYLGEIQKSVLLVDAAGQSRRCMGATFPAHLSKRMKSFILAAMFEMKVTYFDRRLSTVEMILTVVVTFLLFLTLFYSFLVFTYVHGKNINL